MTDTTVINLFKMAPVAPWRTKHAEPVPSPDPSLVYGLELEIENCRDPDEMNVSGMSVTTDGSLRNNGREFITKPMTYSFLVYVLERFFNTNKGLNASNYSERCSVHVHTNVQDMTLQQVSSVALLYQVFERLLFAWVGEDRDKNIFCVPWSETQLTYQTIRKLAESDTLPLYDWQKYTALNLLPITSLGTIEWRHMPGTNDIRRILMWCRLIGSIMRYAKDNTFQELVQEFSALNTNSQYLMAIRRIFGIDAIELEQITDYEQLIEDGVLYLKYGLSGKPKLKLNKTEPIVNDRIMRMVEEMQRNQQANQQAPYMEVNPRRPRRADGANTWIMDDIQFREAEVGLQEPVEDLG